MNRDMGVRKLLPVLIVLLGSALPGRAQNTPAWELFGGYSLLRTDMREYFKQTPIIYNFRGRYTGLQGFEVSITENKNRTVGGTFDFSTHFNGPVIGGVPNKQRSYSLMYGPRLTARFGFATPFAHALFGAQYATVKVTPVGPRASDLSLAMAFGVGFDLNLGKRGAIRLVQADYFRSNNTLSPRANGFRASAGFVWKLGPRR